MEAVQELSLQEEFSVSKFKSDAKHSLGFDISAALLSAPPTGTKASPEQLPSIKHSLFLSYSLYHPPKLDPVLVTLPEDQQGSGQEEQREPLPA